MNVFNKSGGELNRFSRLQDLVYTALNKDLALGFKRYYLGVSWCRCHHPLYSSPRVVKIIVYSCHLPNPGNNGPFLHCTVQCERAVRLQSGGLDGSCTLWNAEHQYLFVTVDRPSRHAHTHTHKGRYHH